MKSQSLKCVRRIGAEPENSSDDDVTYYKKKKTQRMIKEFRNPMRSKLDDVYLTQNDPEWHNFDGIEGRLIEDESEASEKWASDSEDKNRPTH